MSAPTAAPLLTNFAATPITTTPLIILSHGDVAVCTACERGMPFSRLKPHLSKVHSITGDRRRHEIDPISARAVRGPELPHPPHFTALEPFLPTTLGWHCQSPDCSFTTASLERRRRHRPSKHEGQILLNPLWRACVLQRWGRGGGMFGNNTWWIISYDLQLLRPRRNTSLVDSAPVPSMSIATREENAAEEARQNQQEQINREKPYTPPLNWREFDPWLARTRWPDMFKGIHLATSTEASVLPARVISDDYHFGSVEQPLVSSMADEIYIQLIVDAFRAMFARCLETFTSTSRAYLTWLANYGTRYAHDRPVKAMKRISTRSKYMRLFERLLCLMFRVLQTSGSKRRAAIFGFSLKSDHTDIMRKIWRLVGDTGHPLLSMIPGHRSPDSQVGGFMEMQRTDALQQLQTRVTSVPSSHAEEDQNSRRHSRYESLSDVESDSDVDIPSSRSSQPLSSTKRSATNYSSEDELSEHTSEKEVDKLPEDHDDGLAAEYTVIDDALQEAIFELAISILDETSPAGDPRHTVLGHFLGVRAIQSVTGTFRTATQYTPDLAGLLWVGRVLTLEYALPARPYWTLQLPSRDAYPQQLDRLHKIRHLLITTGCEKPMAEVISLLHYGRKVRASDPPSVMLEWSDDYETVSLDDQSIRMDEVRGMAQQSINTCLQHMDALLGGFVPPVQNLYAIRDRFSDRSVGYSFVTDKANALQMLYLKLSCHWREVNVSRQMFSPVTGKWNPESIQLYLKQVEQLQRAMLVAIHITGGQPSRATELLLIKPHNTTTTLRNIYVYQGRITVVSSYNKTRAVTNHSWYIARFLPPQLAHCLFVYLVYIQPFVEFLFVKIRGDTIKADYLFCDLSQPERHWPPDQLRKGMKAISQDLTFQFNVARYRHIVIGISRIHIKSITKHLNIYDDISKKADENQVAFAWQSGHRPRQGGAVYGLEGAFPHKLQPELLNEYRRCSVTWQQWLGVNVSVQGPPSFSPKGPPFSSPIMPPSSSLTMPQLSSSSPPPHILMPTCQQIQYVPGPVSETVQHRSSPLQHPSNPLQHPLNPLQHPSGPLQDAPIPVPQMMQQTPMPIPPVTEPKPNPPGRYAKYFTPVPPLSNPSKASTKETSKPVHTPPPNLQPQLLDIQQKDSPTQDDTDDDSDTINVMPIITKVRPIPVAEPVNSSFRRPKSVKRSVLSPLIARPRPRQVFVDVPPYPSTTIRSRPTRSCRKETPVSYAEEPEKPHRARRIVDSDDSESDFEKTKAERVRRLLKRPRRHAKPTVSSSVDDSDDSAPPASAQPHKKVRRSLSFASVQSVQSSADEALESLRQLPTWWLSSPTVTSPMNNDDDDDGAMLSEERCDMFSEEEGEDWAAAFAEAYM